MSLRQGGLVLVFALAFLDEARILLEGAMLWGPWCAPKLLRRFSRCLHSPLSFGLIPAMSLVWLLFPCLRLVCSMFIFLVAGPQHVPSLVAMPPPLPLPQTVLLQPLFCLYKLVEITSYHHGSKNVIIRHWRGRLCPFVH